MPGSVERERSAGTSQCSNEKGTPAAFQTEIAGFLAWKDFRSKGDDVKMNYEFIMIERENEAEKAKSSGE